MIKSRAVILERSEESRVTNAEWRGAPAGNIRLRYFDLKFTHDGEARKCGMRNDIASWVLIKYTRQARNMALGPHRVRSAECGMILLRGC